MPDNRENFELFREILTGREINPVILGYACYSQFGIDFFTTPLTVIVEYLKSNFELNDLPEENINKMAAIKILFANDLFWNDWPIFEKVSKALNSGIVLFHVMQPLTAEEVTYSILLAKKLRNLPYSDEVKAYITACCLDDGAIYPHPETVSLFLTDKLDDYILTLMKKLEKEYKRIRDNTLPNVKDPIIYAQLAKAVRVKLYVEAKEKEFREQQKKFEPLLVKGKPKLR